VPDLFLVSKSEGSVVTEAGLPPDWQERRRALDVTQSWIVEAPAGSGKTGLLIQRYLKLLADESVEQPEQVLAITFTVKATAEMRGRVVKQLESAVQDGVAEGDSDFASLTRELARSVMLKSERLGWGLLEHSRRLRIRTIDSVCGEIVRLLPVLSGGGGRLTPVEDSTLMYREAARQTLLQLGGTDAELDAALRTVLLHRDGSLAECERLLMEMLPLRNQWGALVPVLGRDAISDRSLDDEVLPELQRALEEVVCAGLSRFAKAVPADFLYTLAELAAGLAQLEPYRRETSPVAVCAGKVGVPSTNAADFEHWRALIHLMVTPSSGRWRKNLAKNTLGFEMTPRQKTTLRSLLDEVAHRDDLLQAIERVNRLPPAVYPQEQWIVTKALFRVLSRALAELKVVFAQRGECDFAEWGLLAEGALREDGAVEDLNSALGMRLQHLLVDEMQDTSNSQYDLIELLTQGWDGHSQTVFLVGDPKQSIYLFRQARVERFVKTMQTQMLGDLPMGLLRLTANFRSQPDLVEAFNDDFSLLFPRDVNGSNPEEVPYVRARATRGIPVTGTQSAVWHTQTLANRERRGGRTQDRRKQSQAQAREVRQIIEHWKRLPLPEGRSESWRIAVLARSRNVLPAIVAELKDETRGSIPFRAVNIEVLGERQEVLDLFALTRALLHPADRVAWFAVLHAPWCGLGLTDLHTLAGADDPAWAERCVEDLIAKRGGFLSDEASARLMRTWAALHAAQKHRVGLSIAERVERTWRTLGGDAYLRVSELDNARRYLELLDQLEEDAGSIDLQSLQGRLNSLFAETATGADLVDLMTIHGAKGLEWDVVIVPGLEKRAPVDRPKLVTWSEIETSDESAANIMLAPIAGRGEGSKALNEWLRGLVKDREAAERKRLFYVACTRAREELHLFASPEMTGSDKVATGHGSLLTAAWPAASRHFSTNATMYRVDVPLGSESVTAEVTYDEEPEPERFDGVIAAAVETQADLPRAVLKRVPIDFDPALRFRLNNTPPDGSYEAANKPARLQRPEGSFEARAFGNVVHTFLELLTHRLAAGEDVSPLLRDISQWSSRIAAVLRGNGLSSTAIAAMTERVKLALSNTLLDPQGRWLLKARDHAFSELALTSVEAGFNTRRMDRVFFAGETPLSEGNECLWIVDYKTTVHGQRAIEDFLAAERETYSPQLETYALLMQERVKNCNLRVGLYYPLLTRLVWWEA